MSTIIFSGAIRPAIYAAFQSTKVPGARATADEFYTYLLANEAVFEFTLEVQTAKGVVTLVHRATAKNAQYDPDRTGYICEASSAGPLNDIGKAIGTTGTSATMKSLKVWLKPFFLEMLKLMTRTSADTFNLARPDPASEKAVEVSFVHTRTGAKITVTHPDNFQREIKEIPCDVVGMSVIPAAAAGQPPAVTFYVTMRVREKLSPADRDEVTRILIAADYSKIYKFGKTDRPDRWFLDPAVPPTGIEKQLKIWEKNVCHYLWNHTSFDRALTIKKEIIDRAAANIAKPLLEVVQGIRDDIDARLVTANHWGDLREDFKTERFQRKLSDLFGAIHQKQFFSASPVALQRILRTAFGQRVFLGIDPTKAVDFDVDEQAALSFAWGTGHCGEHSRASFSIVRNLMVTGNAAKFSAVILTGNSNVDHAFVVGGFRVSAIIQTKFTKDHFADGKAGTDVTVWDLRDMLSKNPGNDGFVLDPYLAPTRQARTVKELLTRINDPSRGPKRTDFLSFQAQHPPDPKPAVGNAIGLRGL